MYLFIRAISGAPYTGSLISSISLRRGRPCFQVSSPAKHRSFGILQSPRYTYSATNIDSRKLYESRSISMQNRLMTEEAQNFDESEPKDEWNDRLPKFHDIKVKGKGKGAGWESVEAVLMLHRDKTGRGPRVWASLSGRKRTMDDPALEWPSEKGPVIRRELEDGEENVFQGIWDQPEGPRKFVVHEKTGPDARLFWGEVLKRGELNDEESEIE